MIFGEIRVKNKREIMRTHREEIMNILQKSLFNYNDFSAYNIRSYVEEILNESEYDPKKDTFYEVITNTPISSKMFAHDVLNHIQENMDYYLRG